MTDAPARPVPPLLLAAAVFVAAYVLTLATRLQPVYFQPWWPRLLSGWLVIAASLAFVELGRRQQFAPRRLAAILACSALFVFAVTYLRFRDPSILVSKDLAQLAIAALLGGLLARHILHDDVLLTISALVVVTDLWSVNRGVTRALIDANVLDYFLLNFPVLLRQEIGYFIGTSDFVLATIYLAFAERAGAARWKPLLALLLGMGTAATLAIVLARPLPVLPFMVPLYHLLVFPCRLTLGREGLNLLVAGGAALAVLAMLR
jgi:hypothetical protein